MQEKKQVMRFSDAELSVIKNTFAGNDLLMRCIRKVFWQVALTKDEAALVLSTFKDKPALEAVVRKTFLPELEVEAPIYQVIDLWMTVSINDKSPEEAHPYLLARNLLIKYISQQLDSLFGKSIKQPVKFAPLSEIDGKEEKQAYVDMIARNTLISHVEQQIGQLSLLAGQKSETIEETKTRLAKDSLK